MITYHRRCCCWSCRAVKKKEKKKGRKLEYISRQNNKACYSKIYFFIFSKNLHFITVFSCSSMWCKRWALATLTYMQMIRKWNPVTGGGEAKRSRKNKSTGAAQVGVKSPHDALKMSRLGARRAGQLVVTAPQQLQPSWTLLYPRRSQTTTWGIFSPSFTTVGESCAADTHRENTASESRRVCPLI